MEKIGEGVTSFKGSMHSRNKLHDLHIISLSFNDDYSGLQHSVNHYWDSDEFLPLGGQSASRLMQVVDATGLCFIWSLYRKDSDLANQIHSRRRSSLHHAFQLDENNTSRIILHSSYWYSNPESVQKKGPPEPGGSTCPFHHGSAYHFISIRVQGSQVTQP